jgi:hypothetical protein
MGAGLQRLRARRQELLRQSRACRRSMTRHVLRLNTEYAKAQRWLSIAQAGAAVCLSFQAFRSKPKGEWLARGLSLLALLETARELREGIRNLRAEAAATPAGSRVQPGEVLGL